MSSQQDKANIETIKRVADGRQPRAAESYVTEGDIRVFGAGPVDENLEAAKEFVSSLPQEGFSTHMLADEMPKVPGQNAGYDAVEPPHYKRGPVIKGHIGSNITKGLSGWTHVIQCIEVMEHIRDPRLATAFKYLWRVAFGGKREPGETRTQREIDERDINSAIWYLQRWLTNPVEDEDRHAGPGYDRYEVKTFGEETVVAVHETAE